MKRALRHFFNRLIGNTVLINKRTNEAHNTSEKHNNCKQHLIADHNRMYVSMSKFMQMMEDDTSLNGCRWCMSGFDKG